MTQSSITVIGIWAVCLADALNQGLQLPTSSISQGPFPDETALLLLLVPFAFFLIAAFLQRPMKISPPVLSRAVDARFGIGTFDNWMSRLNPVALFMSGAIVLGGTGLVSTYLSTQHRGAYVISGFFLSGGFGLACAYILSAIFPPRLT